MTCTVREEVFKNTYFCSDTAIQLQPVFAQWIQNSHYLAPNLTALNVDASTTPAWGGEIVSVGGKVAMMPISLGTADFMVHHIHAFIVSVKQKSSRWVNLHL